MSIEKSHGVGEVAAKNPLARAVATHVGHGVVSANHGPSCNFWGAIGRPQVCKHLPFQSSNQAFNLADLAMALSRALLELQLHDLLPILPVAVLCVLLLCQA